MVGVPCSAASITASPHPSRTDGSSIAADDASSRSRSSASSRPSSSTRSPAPRDSTYLRSSSSHHPAPMMRSRRPGWRGASATTASTACSSRLCGTSRLSVHSVSGDRATSWSGRRSAPLGTTWTRPTSRAGEVGCRRLRDRQEGQSPVGTDREALDHPADAAAPAGVDHPPLLPVEVVHEGDRRSSAHQSGTEGDPVDDLDHRVGTPARPEQGPGETTGIDRESVPAAEEAHTAA